MPDRSQSEVLGYVLVFSVVILTVALVTIAGQAGLQETRDTQQTANLEAGFQVLAENVDDVIREGVPSRATELDLSGERIGLGSPVTVTVTATYSNGTEAFTRSVSYRPIVYRTESGTELVYSNGAVIVSGPGGGAEMLRTPPLVLSGERALVPVVNTTLDRRQLRGGADAVDSQSRILIRTERRGRRVAVANGTDLTLTIAVESPRAEAWAEIGGCSLSGNTATCSYSTGRATAVLTRIAVSFEG